MAKRSVLLNNIISGISKPQINAQNQTIFQLIIYFDVFIVPSMTRMQPSPRLLKHVDTKTIRDGLACAPKYIMASPSGLFSISLIVS